MADEKVNSEWFIFRKMVWVTAAELVDPIIEKHGLTEYKYGPNVFSTISTTTKVEQHIDEISRVADWLIGADDGS